MAVPGPGDPPLGAARSGGVLRGHQPQVGRDRAAREPVPITDLDRERERAVLGAVLGLEHGETRVFERVAQHLPDGAGIIDRQNNLAHRSLSPMFNNSARPSILMFSAKSAFMLWRRMRPPPACAMLLAPEART